VIALGDASESTVKEFERDFIDGGDQARSGGGD